MKNPQPITIFLLPLLLLTASLSQATLPGSIGSLSKNLTPDKNNNEDSDNNDGGLGRFFGPGSGFGIPGFGDGWKNGIIGGGYGSGYGGPSGGYSKGGTITNTVVCKEKGPCYKKKIRCPAKCFTSFSRSGKGFGGGGGGGSCTIDCKKNCNASC